MTRGILKDATILMVDDELTTIEITELFLQTEGYRKFIHTTDPREALDLLRSEKPDVLLLDLIMPHIDGLDVLASVRSDAELQHTPVIILTSADDSDTKLRALELGVTDFLSKPVDASELALRLRNTLAAREHYHKLERMVEARTVEVNQMRIRAENASRAKSEFLARMSHELRTPITAISGYAEVLLEDPRVAADQREGLETIRRNGDHLLGMVNMILDLCEMEAGQLQVESAPVDLVELLERVVREHRAAADERQNELLLEFASSVPTLVLSDARRLRQALGNLVGNAIKFTKQGSVRVQLHYSAADSVARIEIRDTGVGVAPERIPSLFLGFEQPDASTARHFAGAGLSLAVTRRIARLLGGDCTMQSQPGSGTTVLLCLRALGAPGAVLREVGQAPAPRPRQRPAGAPGGRQRRVPRILLVEDGVDNQKLISLILRKAGAEVEIAENGRVAVECVQAGARFDLILMDMAMPEMDGYQATRALRDLGCELPIVALTAHGLTGERQRCLAVGCDDYATKPIDKLELIRIARAALCKRPKPHPAN